MHVHPVHLPWVRPCIHQCRGSKKFWYGSGSADPYLRLMDPDSDPDADADPTIFAVTFKTFFVYYFLKVHLHHC